jgi:hypothetical protein
MKKIICFVAIVLMFSILLPSRTIKIEASKTQDIWAGYPELKRACSCESWGSPDKEPREFKDGKLLRGTPNQNDVGACQISTTYWLKKSADMGYDIFTYKGNVEFAKYLFNKYGMSPWLWSKHCWEN